MEMIVIAHAGHWALGLLQATPVLRDRRDRAARPPGLTQAPGVRARSERHRARRLALSQPLRLASAQMRLRCSVITRRRTRRRSGDFVRSYSLIQRRSAGV